MSTVFPSAVQVSGEAAAQTLFGRGFLPVSTASIAKFRVVVAASSSDDKAVCNPALATALNGGRNFVGIATADRTVDAAGQDSSGIEVQVAGIARATLKANTTCKKGDECGYDPSLDGVVEPVTPANRGKLVVIGHFDQSKTSITDQQLVSVALLGAPGGSGGGAVTASYTSSTTITNTATETAFSVTGSIPANRIISAGTRARVKARVAVSGGNANDTLQLKAYLGSVAAGNLIGQTPAIDVTNAGGDVGVLDIEALFSAVGVSGAARSMGFAGISPGQAVATGGNVQTTGSPVASVSVDTTAAIPVIITATWSAASASNVCALELLLVEVKD